MSKSAIVSGFEKFGTYSSNPTEVLVRELTDETVGGFDIEGLVLPTRIFPAAGTLNSGELLVERARSQEASAILSFGIDSSVKGFRVESTGKNWIENYKYCSENENLRVIDDSEGRDHTLPIDLSDWDVAMLYSAIAERQITIEEEISKDAGSYCCNALIYNTLRAMKKFGYQVPFLFVHCSCTERSVSNLTDFNRNQKFLIKEEDLFSATEAILLSTC